MAVTWDEEHHRPVLPPGRAAGVQDGGASSVVCGHETLMNVLTLLKNKGARQDEFLFSRTQKSFLFGGMPQVSPTGACTSPCGLPVPRGGSSVSSLPATPRSLSAVLKALGVKTDYQADLVSVLGEEWTRAAR